MTIIGITGTIGAGKGTIVNYLVHKKGFLHFSVREFIAGQLKSLNMPVNRDTLTELANQLRAEHSPSWIIDRLFERALASGRNCVIESIRTPGEIDSLRAKGNFFLFAVDALPENRYRRIRKRNSETDQVSFETFLENEKREMNSTDPNKQNLKQCIRQADYLFDNNGSIAGLQHKLEKVLEQILTTD